MKLPTWSLRSLIASVLVVAMSLAALLNPTSDIAFAAGVIVAFALIGGVALAIGARGSYRASFVAFSLTCAMVLYLNDRNRKLFPDLPMFSVATADWLNEHFAWAEWKGPPWKFVYWSEDDRVQYVSFDSRGYARSTGSLSAAEAERSLRGVIDLDNLPTQCPYPRPSLLALRQIVTLLSALASGMLAGRLAYAASTRTG